MTLARAIDPGPALFALAARGVLRVREVGEAFRVKRPDGLPLQSVCVVQADFTWADETLGTTGRGVFSLARHLGIPMEDVLAIL